MILKSVDFLEVQTNRLIKEITRLEAELESKLDFEAKELTLKQLDQCEERLRVYINRCEMEQENIKKFCNSSV